MNIPKANDSNNGKNCTTLNNFILPCYYIVFYLHTMIFILVKKRDNGLSKMD
jgi:hypothetical protein